MLNSEVVPQMYNRGNVTEIPFVDESSERELLSLLGDWYEPNLSILFSLLLLPMLSFFLLLLGVPPCRFCSSTVEHLVVASCHWSHRTSNYSGTCCT